MASRLWTSIQQFSDPANAQPGSPDYEVAVRLSIALRAVVPLWVLALIAGNSVAFAQKLVPTLLILANLAGAAVSVRLARRGRARLGAWMLLLSSWIVVTASVWFAGGLSTILPIFYVVQTIAAGWLLGYRATLLHTVMSWAAVVAMVIVDTAGPGLTRYFEVPAPAGLLMFVIATALVSFPSLQIGRAIDAAESKTRSKSRELEIAESNLLSSEERRHVLFTRTHDAIFIVESGTGIIVDANPSAEALIGRFVDELRTLHDSDLCLAGRTEVVHRDGHRIPVETAETQWTDPNGKTFVFLVCRDISERRKAEAALRDSEAKFRANFMTSTDALYVASVQNGRILDVNKSFEALLGYSRAESIGCTTLGLNIWANVADRNAALDKMDADGRIVEFETYFRRKDGEQFRASICGVPLMLEGELHIAAAIRDVTERRLVESALRASEQRFRALAETSLVGIYVLQEGRFTYVNPALGDILGYRADDMIGRTAFEFVHPDDRARAAENMRKRLNGESDFVQYEYQAIHKDGSTRHVELYGSRIEIDGRPSMVGTVLDITARKRSEAAVRDSEEKFRATFMTGAAASSVTTLDESRFVEVNGAFENLFGYSRDELMGRTALELGLYARPADRSSVLAELQNGGRVIDFEAVGRKKNGEEFLASLSFAPFTVGGVAHIACSIRDITESRRAAEALRASEQKFAALFRHSPVGMTVSDMSDGYRLLEVNEAFERYTGYSREMVIGRDHQDEWLWVDEDSYVVASTEFVKRGKISDYEFQFRRRNGEIRTGILSAEVIEMSGKPCCLASTIDITERKQAEAALRDSIERFLTVAKCAPVTIWSVDLSGRFTYVSDHVERLHGWTCEELLNLTFADTVTPRQAAINGLRFAEELNNARLSGYDPQRVLNFESEELRKDGTTFWAEVTASVTRAEDGTPIGITGVTRDITDRKQAEAERERLWEQLAHAQKMECVGRLAGGIAHDFNNLMGAIILNADSAREELGPNDPAAESVEAMQQAAEKAVALGRQLMTFSQKKVLNTEVLDLNSVIFDSHKLLQRLIGEDISLIVIAATDQCTVKADRGQLDQIIMNLALNSRDAMPEGGSVVVQTSSVELNETDTRLNPEARPGRYVLLTVKDTGIGMSHEVLGRIFEPFFTTKETGKGTGLGLYVVYGIVRQNDGFITARSEPGRGAEFRIYLPATSEVPEALQHPEVAPLSAGSERVLLAEDEPALRDKVSQILRKSGYQVLTAENGEEAFRIASRETRRIDVLLTDVVMPGLSGPQLAELLKPVRPDMKVLYMSGYPHADRSGSILQPDADLIAKPFTQDQLLRRMHEALGEKRQATAENHSESEFPALPDQVRSQSSRQA